MRAARVEAAFSLLYKAVFRTVPSRTRAQQQHQVEKLETFVMISREKK